MVLGAGVLQLGTKRCAGHPRRGDQVTSVTSGGLSGLELDAGLEVGMVVDELAPDPGLPGDAGDARVPARFELGVGGGENERALVLAVEPARLSQGLSRVSSHHGLSGRARRRGTAAAMAG